MAQPMTMPPPGFDDLPVEDQRIAAHTDQVPLQDWQRQILDERLAAHRAAPEESRPWEEVLDRLEQQLRQSERQR